MIISPKLWLALFMSAAAVIGIGGLYVAHRTQVSAAYERGHQDERAAAEKRAQELIKKMEADGVDLRKMDRDALVCELAGGVFRNGSCH